jgi:hypothetical protein
MWALFPCLPSIHPRCRHMDTTTEPLPLLLLSVHLSSNTNNDVLSFFLATLLPTAGRRSAKRCGRSTLHPHRP